MNKFYNWLKNWLEEDSYWVYKPRQHVLFYLARDISKDVGEVRENMRRLLEAAERGGINEERSE